MDYRRKITKGQIIPKADWRTIDSPKKRTNKFELEVSSSSFKYFRTVKQKKTEFVRLVFGKTYGAAICFLLNSSFMFGRTHGSMFGRTHCIIFGRTLFEYCVRKDTLPYVRKDTF